jgi:D-alanyl-D-alanine carboxypeptidase
MTLTRRQFGSAALGGALAPLLAPPAFAAAAPGLGAAVQAIRDYGARHLVHFRLPGMTLGLSTPGGLAAVLNFGFADRETHRAITPDTLFEVGSITKVMTAALIEQLAAEGRIRLDDRVSALMPRVALPPGNAITVQQLLDHVSGLASDVPLDARGGLWLGFEPGTHWHYSNAGYEILGNLAEHVTGEPLASLLEKRIFLPLGMTRSRGAIRSTDQALYAQG